MLGQEVGNGKIDNGTLSVGKLSAGTYYLEFMQNEERIKKKFIKL